MKTIYELELHQSIIVKIRPFGNGYPYVWQVTRVPGGWIYQKSSNTQPQEGYFVPFSDD